MKTMMFDNSFNIETGGLKPNGLFDLDLGNSGYQLENVNFGNTGFNPAFGNDFNISKPILPSLELPTLDTSFGNINNLFNTGVVSPPRTNTIKVSGVVKDENGTPIPNAHVVPLGLDNKTIGAVTNFDGRYSLEVPKDTLLQVSYTGLSTIKDKANTTIKNFTLKETAESLDEITVVSKLKNNKQFYWIGGAVTILALGLFLTSNKKGKKAGLKAAQVTI